MDKKLALTILFNGVDKLSGSLKQIAGLGKTGAQELGGLRREMANVRREMDGASGNVTALINREHQLAAAIERRQRLMQIDNKVGKMHARGDALMATGQDNMFSGAAMLALPAVAIKMASDYDKKLALLAQKTDLNKVQTAAFGREIVAAARAAKQLPDTMMAGADFLASKGVELAQINSLIPAIGRFATAWDADVLDASKAAHANMLSLKVPALQSARALEIMGIAGKRGGFEVKDMAQHFPVLASQLATMGAKGLPAVASLSAALQVLEAKTGDGALAANDLANMMRFTQTKQGIDNFRKFGIDIVAELKKAEADGRDPLERLAELTSKAVGGDNSKIASLFTDQQAGRGALNLVSSIAQYRKIRDEAFAAQGVTAQEFDRMSETSDANMRSLMGSLSGLGVSLGTHLLPLVTRGADMLARFTNAVADWSAQNPRLASGLVSIVVAGGALRVGLGALQFAFGGILKPMASAWGIYQKWKTAGSVAAAFPKVVKAFGVLRNAAIFLGKGFLRAGLMMLGNPMILIIAAIVLAIGVAGYLIYKHWDTIKAAFYSAVDWLGGVWQNIRGLMERFPWLFGPIGLVVGFVSTHWDTISSAFNTGIEKVKGFFSGLPDWLKTIGGQMMMGLISALNPALLVVRLLSVAKQGITAFKNYFGIKSPSRLFMQMGGFMTEGLARGVEGGQGRPLQAIGKLATGVAGAMALSASPAAAQGSGSTSGVSAGGVTIGSLTIHQQPGEDSQALVKRIVDEIERRAAAARRGGYFDVD